MTLRSTPDLGTPTAYLVVYSGRVQGVGFRFTVMGFARAFAHVTGYVKNLPDGTVEAWIEGPANEVEALLEDVACGPHAGYIRKVGTQAVEPSGRYAGFSVVY